MELELWDFGIFWGLCICLGLFALALIGVFVVLMRNSLAIYRKGECPHCCETISRVVDFCPNCGRPSPFGPH